MFLVIQVFWLKYNQIYLRIFICDIWLTDLEQGFNLAGVEQII